MPLLARLIAGWFTRWFSFLSAAIGFQWAIRVTVLAGVAAVYISLVTAFNLFISPLLSQLFATSYGTVIGLAFPPIAGTVVSGVALLWVAKVGYSYIERMARFITG
ncbi:MAG: hypothetical protein N2256_04800 [Tepidimonas ignava]|nr:hypothetical protein [Tepidimonas ignava]